MERLFLKKEITAVIFIVILFAFSLCNFVGNFSAIKAAVLGDKKGKVTTVSDYIKNLETTVNENIIGKYGFIEAYGAMNLILNKKEENNFEEVKDNEGVLYNTYFANKVNGEINDAIKSVSKLHDISISSGAKFLVTMPPDKFMNGVTNMDKGYPYNYSNENNDYYLSKLTELGIDNLDLRIPLLKSGWNLDNIFYKTDHHWTTQASFKVYQYLAKSMEKKYSISLDKNGYYTNENNYNFINYEKQYLGSQGRKTGVIYSGLDDFVMVYPKFKTNFSFSISEYGYSGEGRMEDSLIDISVLNRNTNIYEKDYYGMYMFGVSYPFATIQNKLYTDGPRVLVIRDSFACAPMTYFSTLCSRMDVVYPLYYTNSIKDLIEKGNYDYVIMMVYPGNFSRKFYDFKY